MYRLYRLYCPFDTVRSVTTVSPLVYRLYSLYRIMYTLQSFTAVTPLVYRLYCKIYTERSAPVVTPPDELTVQSLLYNIHCTFCHYSDPLVYRLYRVYCTIYTLQSVTVVTPPGVQTVQTVHSLYCSLYTVQ